MKKYKIGAEEFNKVSLTRISNTPSSPSQYNGARLGAEELKKRLDAPLELFRDKLNALVDLLLGEGDDSAIAHIYTGIKEGHTISQMLKDIVSESADFASYLSVGEKSLLKRLEEIGKSIDEMGIALDDCVDKNTYERKIDSINQDMISYKNAASAAIEALGRDLSDKEAALIESIAQSLTSAKKYADETKVGKSGDQTIGGSLSISGDLLVSGNNYAKQMESLEVGDAVIIANANGVLLSELSGYVIRVNEAKAYAIVYDPADDCVKIGLGTYNSDTKVFAFLEGEAQVLATRADIADGNIPAWDNDKKTFRDSGYKVGDFAKKGDVPTSVANALIGSEMGEVVALKDVSPIEHRLRVKVESKNKINAPDKTVSGTTAWYAEKLGSYTLPNGTYTISCDIEKSASAVPCIKLLRLKDGSGVKEHAVISNGKMTTSFTVDDSFGGGIIIFLYSNLSGNAVETSCTYSNIQVEPGTTATPCTPYISDTSGVKLLVQGKNLFDVSKIQTSGTVINNNDGTILVKGSGQSTGRRFGELCPNLKVGDTFTISLRITNAVQDTKEVSYIHVGDPYKATLNSRKSYTVTEDMLNGTVFLYKADYANADKVTEGVVSEIQVELDAESEYEPYKEPIEYSQGEEIKSIYPSTTLMTDTAGAVISVEYNRDLNKAFEELMNLILSLGGNLYV